MKKTLRITAAASVVAAISATAITVKPEMVQLTPAQADPTCEKYVNAALFEDVTDRAPSLAESSDSVTVTINLLNKSALRDANLCALLPTDITKLGTSFKNTLKDSYVYRVPKGEYEFWLWGELLNYEGHALGWLGNLNCTTDTAFTLDVNDINIRTVYDLRTPAGEVIQPDLYISSTKTIAEKGNVRTSGACTVAMKLNARNVHFNHTCHNLTYQSLNAGGIITNTHNSTRVWVNTKEIPMDFMIAYKYNGDDGVYGMRYDVHKGNFGDTLRLDKADWKLMDMKHKEIICDSINPNYPPEYYNGNGSVIWLNGVMQNMSIGCSAALPTDARFKYWINYNPKGFDNGYNFAILPGIPMTAIGTKTYTYNPLPLNTDEKGNIKYAPFQAVLSGLKIWSFSDGTTCFIDSTTNPRLNADENTIWGQGFPYAGLYPTYSSKVTGPQYDVDVKGFNGEQRGGDLLLGNMYAYRVKTDAPDTLLWEGKFEKLSVMNTAIRNAITAQGAGRFATEFVDTAYKIDGIRGKSITRIEYSTDKGDFIAPTLTMVNVRNKEDRITDELQNVEGATVEVMAADLTGLIKSFYGYIRTDIKGVKVEYAPNGSTEFVELPVVENKDRKMDLFWGQNYSANMEKINVKSNNNLYDLRITAEDPVGNTCSVYASPAFKLNSLDGLEINSIGESYIVVDNGTIRAAGMDNATINVYDLQGRLVASGIGSIDATELAGLYIVKAADLNNTLTSKVMIK